MADKSAAEGALSAPAPPQAEEFLRKLRKDDSIVSSDGCSEMEIATARACHRFLILDGLGYVYRPRLGPLRCLATQHAETDENPHQCECVHGHNGEHRFTALMILNRPIERLPYIERAAAPAPPHEAELERLRHEIGLTHERLDELDEHGKPLYDFVPQMIDDLHRELFSLRKQLASAPAPPALEQLIAQIDHCLIETAEEGVGNYAEHLPALGKFLRDVRAALADVARLQTPRTYTASERDNEIDVRDMELAEGALAPASPKDTQP